MALTDEVFQKHLNATKKPFRKQYNHFRPFDDPDHKNKDLFIESNTKNNQPVSPENPINNDSIHNPLDPSMALENHKTQSRHKVDTSKTQKEQELNTNGSQREHFLDTNEAQSVHKLLTKPNTNGYTNQTQKTSKLHIRSIVGNQKKLLFYIYDLCRIQGTKTTPPLNIESICENTGVEKGSIKTSLIRLIQKKFLIREEIKTGRSGWVMFKIPDQVYQELFNHDLSFSLTQTRHKSNTESNTKSDTMDSIVSSSNYINTTTISDDFRKIDYSPLKAIGFDESHIIQIYREYTQKPELSLSIDIIQNSINALAFDLKYNNVASSFKISPAVVLTSLLKKGQPYSSKTPEKVLTPQEEAMQSYLLAQEKKQQMVTEIESKAKSLALQEWLDLLSEDELLKFNQEPRLEGIPDKIYQISRRKKAIEFAKDYFNIVLWDKKRKEILDETKQKI